MLRTSYRVIILIGMDMLHTLLRRTVFVEGDGTFSEHTGSINCFVTVVENNTNLENVGTVNDIETSVKRLITVGE